MGLFDIFKKKEESGQEQNEEFNAQGWDAITKECERVYPDQKSPKHYGTLIKWQLGGNDPLDGISIYDGGDYWHFVTYGLSELYDKETDDKAVSGYGMEFTFKLKKDNYEDEEAEIKCICGILQSIARITFTKGEVFAPYEYLYTGQTQGIDTKMQSNITGFITIPDKELRAISTPNGKVEFVEFIGATDAELVALRECETDVKALYEEIGSDVTSYSRKSVK
ncbi:MAG: suppressor of fused domain protein [Butyrivibrio sp.]|nr:suppressor of fused domain protein [Muribaculum sp.]MCM1551616.1 suppressor of fused domain protein [Butyrivibrio sp.]